MNEIFLNFSQSLPGSHIQFTSIDYTRQLKQHGKPSFNPNTILLRNTSVLNTVIFKHLVKKNPGK
jgi:hypothetical protein